MPASRSARAMILAPRSWPSRPGFATTTRIFFSVGEAIGGSGILDLRCGAPARRAPSSPPRTEATPDHDPRLRSAPARATSASSSAARGGLNHSANLADAVQGLITELLHSAGGRPREVAPAQRAGRDLAL